MMLHYALLNVIFKKFYLVLAVLGPCCCTGFSLVSVSRGYSPAVVLSFSLPVVSRVAERKLQGTWAQHCGAQAQPLCDMWNLPRSGIEPMSPTLAGRFFTTEPPGKSQALSLLKSLLE